MRRLFVAILALAAAGCVSTGRYERKVQEADALRADGARLAKELADEKGERAALDAKLEALQAQQVKLGVEADALRAELGERKASADDQVKSLEARLAATEAERRRLAGMVDALSSDKQALEAAKAELEKQGKEYASLADSLRGEIDAGRIELSTLKGRMTVKMKDKILFASGSAKLNRQGRGALTALAGALMGLENKSIRVEGHTDDRPTAGTAFPSNWELSVARALAVVRFLEGQGLDPGRLAAAGYGEHRPVAGNDTPEGRSQNRRIEIVLAPIEVPPVAGAVTQ